MQPEPSLWLQIGTDPTAWLLKDTDANAVTEKLIQATGPVALTIIGPFQGRLLLSPRRAGTISLLGPPASDHGSHPTDDKWPTRPVVYFPSVSGATQDSPGHALNPDTDLGALERDILIAMTDGARLSLRISALSGLKLLVVDGAVLAFAVVGQAST